MYEWVIVGVVLLHAIDRVFLALRLRKDRDELMTLWRDERAQWNARSETQYSMIVDLRGQLTTAQAELGRRKLTKIKPAEIAAADVPRRPAQTNGHLDFPGIRGNH